MRHLDRTVREQIIEIPDGIVKIDAQADIVAGDVYIAKRNTGWKLLTCRDHDLENRIVHPVELAYSFDTHECYKVTELLD